MKSSTGSILCLALLSALIVPAMRSEVEVYPGPDPSLTCDRYRVTISQDGATTEVFVLQNESGWEDQSYFKSIRIYETLSYAGFSFTGTITVEVTKMASGRTGTAERTLSVRVRPERFGIEPEVNGLSARFSLDRPGQYSVEFIDEDLDQNGSPRHALILFADPPEEASGIPDPGDKGVLVVKPGRKAPRDARGRAVVRFEAGIHELGLWDVPPEVEQIYLAPGSFVNGAFRIENRENGFLLNGRGTLSGKSMGWHFREPVEEGKDRRDKGDIVRLIRMDGTGITVDGITLTDSPGQAVLGTGSRHLIRWVKIIGWKDDNGGIEGLKDSIIEHCFIRANDDAIRLYDDDLVVREIVFWQGENGACLQLGWQSTAARNIVVRDVDVIHTEWPTDRHLSQAGFLNLRIRSTGPGGPRIQEDFLFENINIESPSVYTIDLRMRKDAGEGGGAHTIRNFTFRNIRMRMQGQSPYATAVLLPWDESHGFENIVFENVRVNDVLVTEKNHANEGRIDLSPLAVPQVQFIAQTEAMTWKNPLNSAPHHLHEPSIIRQGDHYYIAGIIQAKNADANRVEIWRADYPSTWEKQTPLKAEGIASIGSLDLFYHPMNRRYYLVFEREQPEGKPPIIELMTAASIGGPWHSVKGEEPLARGTDPSLFLDRNGRVYLLLGGVSIREIDLESAKTIAGPVVLLRTDQESESATVPAHPALCRKSGTYMLFWTEADSEQGTLHAASSPTIWGPYRIHRNNPIYGAPGTLPFASSDIFKGPDEGWWIMTTQTRAAKSHYSIDRIHIDEHTLAVTAEQTREPQTVDVPARKPGTQTGGG